VNANSQPAPRPWSRRRSIVTVTLVFGFLTVGTCASCSALYLYVWCGGRSSFELQSPDGRYGAEVHYVDCEPMGGSGTKSVILRDSGTRTLLPGLPRGDTVFAARADLLPVTIEWTDARILTVRYPPDLHPSRIIRQDDSWKDVEIIYLPLEGST